MSFSLALNLSEQLSRAAKRRAGLGAIVRRDGSPIDRRNIGAIGEVSTGGVVAIVGIVAVLALFALGLWAEYVRFRDGTKWERITQAAAIIVRMLEIPAVFASAPPQAIAGLELLSSGLGLYASGHQAYRGEHMILNGLSLIGNAWSAADGVSLLTRGKPLFSLSPVDEPSSADGASSSLEA